jgi:hypothetical protein
LTAVSAYKQTSSATSPHSVTSRTTQPSPYNFHEWNNWAHTVSKNKNAKVFMGVPGNHGAGRGYVPSGGLGPVIEHTAKNNDRFGGVMVWDASQAFSNGEFVKDVKEKLNEATGEESHHRRAGGRRSVGRRFAA